LKEQEIRSVRVHRPGTAAITTEVGAAKLFTTTTATKVVIVAVIATTVRAPIAVERPGLAAVRAAVNLPD